MASSIYSSLSPARNSDKETYRGRWCGRDVEFDRVFRGYRFSDEECEALLMNEMIEVHGLERNGVKYSVAGCLQESSFSGFSQDFVSVRFKADHTVSYDPEYSFANRRVTRADGTVIVPEQPAPKPAVYDSTADDEAFIASFDPSMMSSEDAEMDARLSAMLEAPVLPQIVQVSAPGEIPRFMPVFALLSEDVLNAAAQANANVI